MIKPPISQEIIDDYRNKLSKMPVYCGNDGLIDARVKMFIKTYDNLDGNEAESETKFQENCGFDKDWCHPDYSDEIVECMNYEDVIKTFEKIDKLPFSYELRNPKDLKDLLKETIHSEKVKNRYEIIEKQKEDHRIKKLQDDLDDLNSRIWGIENSTVKYAKDGDLDKTDSIMKYTDVLVYRHLNSRTRKVRDSASFRKRFALDDNEAKRAKELSDRVIKNISDHIIQYTPDTQNGVNLENIEPDPNAKTLSTMPRFERAKKLPIKIGEMSELTYCLTDVANIAFNQLLDHNTPPTIFQKGGTLMHIKKVPSKEVPNGIPKLSEMTNPKLRSALDHLCYFYSDSILNQVQERPPKDVVDTIITSCDYERIPQISYISECPIIDNEGNIQTEEGYNPINGGVYYFPTGKVNLVVPDNPTDQDILNAVDVIEDIIGEYSWGSPADKANYVGVLLSTIVRHIIPYPGLCPLLLITKPKQGAGASYLARTLELVKSGNEPSMIGVQSNDAEWEKEILTLAKQGSSLIIIDNIEDLLHSPALSKQLLSPKATGRLLGGNEQGEYDFAPQWVGTGINIKVSRDMSRRSIPAELIPTVEEPWKIPDSQWKHPDILKYVVSRRSEILSSVFTLVRAWIQNGKPKPHFNVCNLAGYSEYRDTIGGILSLTKYGEVFWSNLDIMAKHSDIETSEQSEFLTAIVEIAGFEEFNASKIAIQFNQSDMYLSTLPTSILDKKSKGRDLSKLIGHYLSNITNSIHTVMWEHPEHGAYGKRVSEKIQIQIISDDNNLKHKTYKIIKH